VAQRVSGERELYIRYPMSSLFIYNGVTALHFLLGGMGIALGYGFSGAAYLAGALYVTFAFGQMYVLMPLMVCRNCTYYRLTNSLCTTGLNVISRRIAREGNSDEFARRAQGPLCHNNLYMAALVLPIVAMLPALIFSFSVVLLAIFAGVVGLLLFRIFVIFTKIACVHCKAKNICPNARSMGLSET
jgi:ABC-type antimicrobial peptide transport system permease subunit